LGRSTTAKITIIIIIIPAANLEACPNKPKCYVVTVTWAQFVLRGLLCQFIIRLDGQQMKTR
jgi:hypothetical protein